ncbi:hypothetical protein BpHYR1_019818 [Brachionus plicatilis]|uniref:Uncharacterized protein n=1 Tax=Brachionus plicatilis TaxID=10195 RepID=A0A3M7RXB7_BRAPC|nr:hypothetical protein BpHYR1_019818 [Brachionus plicatilis]
MEICGLPRLINFQKKQEKISVSICLNVKSLNKAKWRKIMFSDEMKIEETKEKLNSDKNDAVREI